MEENLIDNYLNRLQTNISQNHITPILNGEDPTGNIFEIEDIVDWNFAINPFREVTSYINDLRQNMADLQADLQQQSDNNNLLNFIDSNRNGSFDYMTESINQFNIQLQESEESIEHLNNLERRVNGYLGLLQSLTGFIRRYESINPREQSKVDLLHLRYVVGRRSGGRIRPEDRRYFSPQFFLPVEEQIANYNSLRDLLNNLNSEELTESTFLNNLSRVYDEDRNGVLYRLSDANDFASSRQARRRIHNNDNLAFSPEEMTGYLMNTPNWVIGDVERLIRDPTYSEERLTFFETNARQFGLPIDQNDLTIDKITTSS